MTDFTSWPSRRHTHFALHLNTFHCLLFFLSIRSNCLIACWTSSTTSNRFFDAFKTSHVRSSCILPHNRNYPFRVVVKKTDVNDEDGASFTNTYTVYGAVYKRWVNISIRSNFCICLRRPNAQCLFKTMCVCLDWMKSHSLNNEQSSETINFKLYHILSVEKSVWCSMQVWK